jgi:hypothetical protein
MADRYWVGGSGTWDAATTTNWSISSGGAGGASAPTSVDNAYFDGASDTSAPFTVTLSGSPVCANLIIGDGTTVSVLDQTMTLAGTAINVTIHGSLYFPATNLTRTFTGATILAATSGAHTVTTNGVTLTASSSGNAGIIFGPLSGSSTATWTLGSAVTTTLGTVSSLAGTFNTGNFNVTTPVQLLFSGAQTKTINLGSSTVSTGTAIIFASGANSSNTTLNAGTSTITVSAASPTLNSGLTSGGLTFYNVSFTSAAFGTTTINGANTFNDLNQISRSATGQRFITLSDNQTVNGTLTLGAANTAIRRVQVQSSLTGTQRTITLNGTLAALADVDFRDIAAAGTVATPWTGTRLGNCQGNTNITFAAGVDKYWYSATGAGGSWSAAQWELTAGGTTPSVNNFPLAQDTVILRDTGLNAGQSLTTDSFWNIGAINGSARTLAMTFSTSNVAPIIYGSWTGNSNITVAGSGALFFGAQNATITITSNGTIWTGQVYCDAPGSIFRLADNFTSTYALSNTGPGGARFFGLTRGTLDLNGFTLTGPGLFRSEENFVRGVTFNGGKIVLSGNNIVLLFTGNPGTLTVTGTPTIEATYAGAVGTRSFYSFSGAGTWGVTNTFNITVTGGTDIVDLGITSNNMYYNSIDLSAFGGTVANRILNLYGNMTYGASNTLGASSALPTIFAALSGTQTLTTAGKTLDFPVTFGVTGSTNTVQLLDNCTIGATRAVTLTSGTLDLSNGDRALSCGSFASNNTNTRGILFGAGNITITGNAATVFAIPQGASTFTATGSKNVNFIYSGAIGTRVVNDVGNESNSLNFNVSAGSDTFQMIAGGSATINSLNFTGFAGTFTTSSASDITFFKDLTLVSGMTYSATARFIFGATSGTQQVTTAGKTFNQNIIIDGIGGTVIFQDALTQGSTQTFTLTNGTLNLKSGATSTVGSFVTTGTNQKFLGSSTPGTQATISDASGVNSANYLTISDSFATGGADWEAFYANNNVDAGNNSNWDFGATPILGTEYTYTLRSFTQPRRF